MSTHLTAKQIATLKLALRNRFRVLSEEVRQDVQKSADDRAALAQGVRDLEDESVVDLIVDLDLADTDRDLEELRDVEAALGRMTDGTYGVCIKCGGPIPLDRLTAYPTAKRCQPCQRMRELTFVQKGTPTL